MGYTWFLVRVDREAMKRMIEAEDDDEQEISTRPRVPWKPVLLIIGGLTAMAVGGPAIVEGALRLAERAGIGQGVVGATIVSLGTGAEILALGVSAARKKRAEILGSFAYNLLVTLGLAATIHALTVDARMIAVALPTMIGVHLVLLALIWYGKIPRVIGGFLLAAYLIYLIAVVLV